MFDTAAAEERRYEFNRYVSDSRSSSRMAGLTGGGISYIDLSKLVVTGLPSRVRSQTGWSLTSANDASPLNLELLTA